MSPFNCLRSQCFTLLTEYWRIKDFWRAVFMEFTDEELVWLQSIASEIPVGKRTPVEERWYELAKPKTEAESKMFQLLASMRFSLSESFTSSMDILKTIVQIVSSDPL
ncbi:hypothetical protein AMELA_G00238760 [Ameiurus melas]|uniref:Uncharacterized protein n=1 Tax=Ameiurus melas TaxID=219545 RepID=A0A7J5ZV36_AMEME|nr:hypothetical protein AMELA_G00238760 [Ameiurus melas]